MSNNTVQLVERNEEHNYNLYRSQYIIDNIDGILQHCSVAYDRFNALFPNHDSTWTYKKYNIFCLTATSLHFYNIYKYLIACIKVVEPYDGDRITIAYDITLTPDMRVNLSVMPVL